MDLLSADEEVALGRRAQQGELAARDELVSRNIGLVMKMKGHYQARCRCSEEDLSQAGMLGLIDGANRFNPDAHPGVRFKSIAREYINKEMLLYLYARPIVRVPHSARPSEMANLAAPRTEKSRLKREWMAKSAEVANHKVSHDESDMEDLESATMPDVELDLPTILDKLNPIESDVILRRYGFIDGKKQSLRSLSRMFGYNLAAVIDIHRRALGKIKSELTKDSS